jgi:hypothetical protein
VIEILEDLLVYVTAGGIIVFLAFKEFIAYRLPATHRLNELFNPPRTQGTGGATGSDWINQHKGGD